MAEAAEEDATEAEVVAEGIPGTMIEIKEEEETEVTPKEALPVVPEKGERKEKVIPIS